MRNLRVTDGDAERFLLALAAALALHGALFILLPRLDTTQDEPFDAPLYVALDPLPATDGESEPVPPSIPEPLVREESVADPESSRAESASSAVSAAAPAGRPSASGPDGSAAAQGAAERAFVPPTPPLPPRARVAADLRGDFAPSQSASAEAAFLEQQLQALYDWQETYRRDLEAWEAEQSTGADAGEPSTPPLRPEIDGALERELDRLVDAIRGASTNLIDTAAPGDGEPLATPDADPVQEGGIAIGEGDGRRARIAGDSVALDTVSLGAGFPAEYPVSVRFRVDAAGRVVSASVFPPTPAPDLDFAIIEAVRTWVFQPAPSSDSPVVEGTVTIIVETRAGR
ncbi:MAG: energy transducer TonB [Spirochaetales bacterium]|nr:energy transducer TonB [Spirochaetales bacterium]